MSVFAYAMMLGLPVGCAFGMTAFLGTIILLVLGLVCSMGTTGPSHGRWKLGSWHLLRWWVAYRLCSWYDYSLGHHHFACALTRVVVGFLSGPVSNFTLKQGQLKDALLVVGLTGQSFPSLASVASPAMHPPMMVTRSAAPVVCLVWLCDHVGQLRNDECDTWPTS